MILAVLLGFILGFLAHALAVRFLTKDETQKPSARDDDFIPVGPFAIKKKTNKRRPVSHDDKSAWEREMRDAGKLI